MGLFVINLLLKIGIIEGIQDSSVVVCCITKAYTVSKNCIREITFADVTLQKPLEILMFENLDIAKIGGIGFIITPLVRHNVFNTSNLLNEWSGDEFNKGILKAIKSHLRPDTGSKGGGGGGSSSTLTKSRNPISSALRFFQVII